MGRSSGDRVGCISVLDVGLLKVLLPDGGDWEEDGDVGVITPGPCTVTVKHCQGVGEGDRALQEVEMRKLGEIDGCSCSVVGEVNAPLMMAPWA